MEPVPTSFASAGSYAVSTDEGARQTPWAPAQFLLSEEAWLSATGHCVSYHRFTTKQGIEVP